MLIREESRYPVTKDINSIFLVPAGKESDAVNNGVVAGSTIEPSKEKESVKDDGPTKIPTLDENPVEVPYSHPVKYYLKNKINEKLIKGLVKNRKFNDCLSRTGKLNQKTYKIPPIGPMYEAILKKKVTRKEEIGGNFEIPCNVGGLKSTSALVDQGSDVNVMPFSTYSKLTNERLTETKIRLSLASHSYIYPLGIAEDVLVDVVGYVYPVDFVILDIREDERRPFILGTPFLTTAKASIKFDKG